MQSSLLDSLRLVLSLTGIVVVPILVLYLILSGKQKVRRQSSVGATNQPDWQGELSRRVRTRDRRFRIVVCALFVLGVPLLLLGPPRSAQPKDMAQNQPPLWRAFPFTFFAVMVPSILLIAGISAIAYSMLRHYDAGVSRVAKQASGGDLDGAVIELRRQIESKGSPPHGQTAWDAF